MQETGRRGENHYSANNTEKGKLGVLHREPHGTPNVKNREKCGPWAEVKMDLGRWA